MNDQIDELIGKACFEALRFNSELSEEYYAKKSNILVERTVKAIKELINQAYEQGAKDKRKLLQVGNVATENARGEWVPYVPVPYYLGLGRVRCKCGRVFWSKQRYAEHYSYWHILFPTPPKK
ncbi:MAG TPA: hypothetical protein VFQ86_01855 [Arachidicoccus soli]|nr:hypothetical protein [Arachidicoccus soli]